MSFPDSRALVAPPLHPFPVGDDDIGSWSQFPVNNEEYEVHSHFEYPPHKRTRNSEGQMPNSSPHPSMNPRIHPPNAPTSRGTSNIFFKTRICAKFKLGQCRNGENCNFAHGMEDMRQPPPNWQELVNVGGREEERGTKIWDEDQRIIHKMKLCKKFYNGEECPYGDRCNFLHEDPKKFRDDSARPRESFAISIGTTGPPMEHGSGSNLGSNLSSNLSSMNSGLDPFRGNVKPTYWKTKLCCKWETTGHCPFGEKCHFAHGQAELQMTGGGGGGWAEAEVGNTCSLPAKLPSVPANVSTPPELGTGAPINPERQNKKLLLQSKGFKKINRIYADWIDDLPSLNNKVKD